MEYIFSESIGIIIIIFLFVLAVLWVLLPFLIFGIKKNLESLNQTNREILFEMKKLHEKPLRNKEMGIERKMEPSNEGNIVESTVSSKSCPKCMHENPGTALNCSRCRFFLGI